jgi:hypothetical protein
VKADTLRQQLRNVVADFVGMLRASMQELPGTLSNLLCPWTWLRVLTLFFVESCRYGPRDHAKPRCNKADKQHLFDTFIASGLVDVLEKRNACPEFGVFCVLCTKARRCPRFPPSHNTISLVWQHGSEVLSLRVLESVAKLLPLLHMGRRPLIVLKPRSRFELASREVRAFGVSMVR